VITAFLCSDEYWTNSGGDSGRWLEWVRRDLLGQAEVAGLSDDLDALLAGGSTRPEIVSDLVRRTECHQHLVQTIYGRCLSLDTAASARPT
jgi:hypothetical protein